MNNNKIVDNSEILPDILRLLRDQQKTSERTCALVESMANELVRFREHSEKIAIMLSRLDSLEDDISRLDHKCNVCVQGFNGQILTLEQKREQNKDLINSLDQRVTSHIGTVKEKVQENIQAIESRMAGKFEALKEQIAYSSGKYGAVTAIVTSLIMMVLNWIITHHGSPK